MFNINENGAYLHHAVNHDHLNGVTYHFVTTTREKAEEWLRKVNPLADMILADWKSDVIKSDFTKLPLGEFRTYFKPRDSIQEECDLWGAD